MGSIYIAASTHLGAHGTRHTYGLVHVHEASATCYYYSQTSEEIEYSVTYEYGLVTAMEY